MGKKIQTFWPDMFEIKEDIESYDLLSFYEYIRYESIEISRDIRRLRNYRFAYINNLVRCVNIELKELNG